jgi:hypothetical protein
MAKIYFSGENLFTLTKYTGFDPESNAFGQSIVRIDYNSYPVAKIYMIGLNINF